MHVFFNKSVNIDILHTTAFSICRRRLNTVGNNIHLKIQKATDFVGVPVYVFKVSTFDSEWLCFHPNRNTKHPECNFYITVLYTEDDNGHDTFHRIVPNIHRNIDFSRDCNCLLCPPEVDSSSEKGLT
jgi:hypothetical protein